MLPLFASFAALAFILVSVTEPMSMNAAAAAEITAELSRPLKTQVLAVSGTYTTAMQKDAYGVAARPVQVAPAPVPVPATGKPVSPAGQPASTTRAAPAAGAPNPGSAKAIALDMVTARGWGAEQYNCLVSLWNRESGWNVFAHNGSSGAYGIPQALPGTKMASAGPDWATNPATQITWGLGYITARYATPCGAWAASESKGWY